MAVMIGGATRLMGVIGDPIAQVRTPAAINPIFAAKGADIACVPLHVPAADLATVWAGLRAMLNLVGFGITCRTSNRRWISATVSTRWPSASAL